LYALRFVIHPTSGKRQRRITLRSFTRKRPTSLLAEIAAETPLVRPSWFERTSQLAARWRASVADRVAEQNPLRPEWLADRITLSYEARLLIGEDVTPEQNARDNLLAYAGLYRGRFPKAAYAWMGPPPDTDPQAAINAVRALAKNEWLSHRHSSTDAAAERSD